VSKSWCISFCSSVIPWFCKIIYIFFIWIYLFLFIVLTLFSPIIWNLYSISTNIDAYSISIWSLILNLDLKRLYKFSYFIIFSTLFFNFLFYYIIYLGKTKPKSDSSKLLAWSLSFNKIFKFVNFWFHLH